MKREGEQARERERGGGVEGARNVEHVEVKMNHDRGLNEMQWLMYETNDLKRKKKHTNISHCTPHTRPSPA